MKLNDFKKYLKERKIDTDKIESTVVIINEFENFLSTHEKSVATATYDDMHDFSAYLIENKKNSYDNYIGLARFAFFSKNNPLIIAAIENVDGREMIENFSTRLKEEFGESLRNEIFDGIGMPPLGIHPKKKPEVTKTLVERFLTKVGDEKGAEFFAGGLRDKYTDSYKKPRENYMKTQDIDTFLKSVHEELITNLEKHHEEGSLFYTQEVDTSVIEYVKKDQTIEAGVRKGNKVIITKIPYMTKQYIETDSEKRKYYFCHCPWIREALKDESQPISPVFCHMSGGYYKNYWEAVLDQPVKVELLESVIQGDEVCKFSLHLPPSIMDNLE
ncbi:MAG: hypothetical protein ACXAC8_13210 [Candidatus Hodarchaeales archaeon]|jgi:predicted hydrocarbon binding protein